MLQPEPVLSKIDPLCYYLMFLSDHQMSLLIEEEQKEEGVPVCGANLSSPVVDTAYYVDEIHYRIGNRMYIENAD
jgi:hypothetical protein